jgi:hypothetical protein
MGITGKVALDEAAVELVAFERFPKIDLKKFVISSKI